MSIFENIKMHLLPLKKLGCTNYTIVKLIFYVILFTCQISSHAFSQTPEIDSLIKLVKNGKEDTLKVNRLIKLADQYEKIGQIDSSKIHLQASLKLAIRLNFRRGMARSYNRIGQTHYDQGNYSSAIECFNKAIQLHKEANNRKGIGNNLNSLGLVYNALGNIGKAMECYLNALKIFEALNDKKFIAIVFTNLGSVYLVREDYQKAEEYYQKSLSAAEEAGNREGIARAFDALGEINNERKNYQKAIEYFNKSLSISRESEDLVGNSIAMSHIGIAYGNLKLYDSAMFYLKKSLQIDEMLGQKDGISFTLGNIGCILFYKKETKLAETYLLKSIFIAKEVGILEPLLNANQNLAEMYLTQKDYQRAFKHLKDYHQVKDSLFSIKKSNDITRKEMNYEFEKKEALTKADHDKQIAIADADKKRQRIFSWLITAIAISITLIALVVFRALRVTRKQKHIIEEQKALVEDHQKEIVDSITYAKRIQDAILPPLESIRQKLPASFVLYKPKDIVAGDFYWMEEFDGIIFIAAADCTGHGVPGAMVSVVCSNALTRSVKEFGLRETGMILDKTRELVIETFQKSADDVKDGMDISLLSINVTDKKVNWSGANNPLWMVQNKILKEIKADKQAIGKTYDPKPFATHEIPYDENTVFYLFTDGLADQFGGPKGKKFKYKQFSDLLLGIDWIDLHLQKEKIERSFNDWRGNLEQVDDVCVIGLTV